MDLVIDANLADEQASLIRYKLAFALLYLDCCGMTKNIIFLDSYYVDSSWWGVLGLGIRKISVQYVMCMIYVVYNGMYLVGWVVVVVDRIQR